MNPAIPASSNAAKRISLPIGDDHGNFDLNTPSYVLIDPDRVCGQLDLDATADLCNDKFPLLELSQRIALILQIDRGRVLVTTSGGKQSGVLLSQIAQVRDTAKDPALREAVEQLRIVFLDTGKLFPESIAYIAQLEERLHLNIMRYQHGLSDSELRENIAEIQTHSKMLIDSDAAYDELTKVRPMQAILRHCKPNIWMVGNRRDQAVSREDQPFAEVRHGLLKVCPMADVTEDKIPELLRQMDVPQHPLSTKLRSIGNVTDTAESHGKYEKSGRHNGARDECGLHTGMGKHRETLFEAGDRFESRLPFPVKILKLKVG